MAPVWGNVVESVEGINHLLPALRALWALEPRKPVYTGKRHISPLLSLFGPIRVPVPKGFNWQFNPL